MTKKGTGGHYRDLCEKRDGDWMILRRVCVWDWNQQVDKTPGWSLIKAHEMSNWGNFHPKDPIYLDWYDSPLTHAADALRPEVGQA